MAVVSIQSIQYRCDRLEARDHATRNVQGHFHVQRPLHGYTHYMYTQLAAESHPGEVIYAPTNYGGKSVLLHVDSAVA
uniref:Uncharacterized protein n=1 Tax=Anguilla anguilla TaxID=7936 RepID=A0A0E9T474_ANGAN